MKSSLPRILCLMLLLPLLLSSLIACMDPPSKRPVTSGQGQTDAPDSVTQDGSQTTPADTVPSTSTEPTPSTPTNLPDGAQILWQTALPIPATMADGTATLNARLIHASLENGTTAVYLDALNDSGEILGHILLPGYAQIIALQNEGDDSISGLYVVSVGASFTDPSIFRYAGGLLTFTELTESGAPRPSPAWVGLSHQGQFANTKQSFARVELLLDAMFTEHFNEITHPETDFGTRRFFLLLDSFTDSVTQRYHALADRADPGLSEKLSEKEAGLTPDRVLTLIGG